MTYFPTSRRLASRCSEEVRYLHRMSTFLENEWPKLVKFTPPTRDAARMSNVLARTKLHGVVLPELEQFFTPLMSKVGPRFDAFVPGTWAPALRPDVFNLAEGLFVDAQQYRPLWAEIFYGAFEVGSTPSGNLLLAAYKHDGKGPNFIYRFDHVAEIMEGPIARDLEPLVQAAIANEDLPEFTPEKDLMPMLELRSRWLVTVLGEVNASDVEIRSTFDAEFNAPMTAELLETRAANFGRFPPTAFFSCFVAYFGDDDALAIACAEKAKASTNRLVRDFGVLLLELISGSRKSLGIIEDMPSLRARVRALQLWSEPQAVEPTPEDEVLAKLFLEDGYRNEAAIAEFIANGDRALTNRLIERAAIPERGRSAFLDVLIAWKEASAIDRLVSLATEVDRFHIARGQLVQLIHAVGDARHAPVLLGILKKFGPAVNGSDSSLDGVVARTILALADLKASSAIPAIAKFIDSESKDSSNRIPLSVRDAALFALGELGAKDVFATLLPRIHSDELYFSPGLRWAAGRLGDATILERLESVRVHHRQTLGRDGVTRNRSIASIFNPEVGGQDKDAAAEIALEHSRVLLGCSNDALVELLEAALKSEMKDSVFAWALLAARSQPGLVNTDALRTHSNQLLRQLTSSKR